MSEKPTINGPSCATDWDDLVANDSESDPLLADAILSLNDPFAAGHALRLSVSRGGLLVAGAALRQVRARGIRIAVQHHGEVNRYTPGVLAREGAVDDVVSLLQKTPVDLLRLKELPVQGMLIERLTANDDRLRVSSGANRWIADLRCGSPLPTRIVREVHRAYRYAQREGTPLSIDFIRDRDQLADVVDSVFHLIGESHPAGMDNYAGTPNGREYLREITAAAARDERLEMVMARAAGRPVAVALALAWGERAIGLRIAFDRTQQRLPSLGWVVLAELLDALVERGVVTLDVGSGSDASKRRYCRAIPTVDVIMPLTIRGRTAITLARGRHAVRAIRMRRQPAETDSR